MDTSIMIDEVNTFVERLDFLFFKGGCWTSVGYVAYAASKLRKRIVLQHCKDGRGCAKTIGGHDALPADLQDRVNNRMKAWVRVVVQVSKAEFPEFEVVAAFGVFALLAKERPFFACDDGGVQRNREEDESQHPAACPGVQGASGRLGEANQ